jgi:two-component system catabolic regulation response regulator CreB
MKPRILIVEDEPGIADTLQYALRTDGFDPAWVATGEEALLQVRTAPPALVILDVGLPDLSGFEVFKRLRETADVPVIFLTARSDEIDRVVGLELGADDYVPSRSRRASWSRACARSCAARKPPAQRPRRRRRRSQSTTAAARSASTASCWSCRATSTACCKTLRSRPGHVFTPRRAARAVWDDPSEAWTAPSMPT